MSNGLVKLGFVLEREILMDVLVELLPPSFTAKTEPAAKDSRRQQPQKNKQAKARAAEPDHEQVTLKTTAKPILDTERRSGEERRQQRMVRGRWLESRDRYDRRTTALSVFVKV